jgi:NTP pyrophosphatase (non-canonical NTP hydrolase)
MLSIKHVLASKADSKATINDSSLKPLLNGLNVGDNITLYYHDYNCAISYHSSRNGTTWYADSKFPPEMISPKIGYPVYYNVSIVEPEDTFFGIGLTDEFQPIRNWACDKGLYKKGDLKTQTVKLQEEVGELANAVLREDYSQIQDAIGDIVVVLTNLAYLSEMTIEECINVAYMQIKNRTGSMQNGTFVKDAK